MASKNIDERWTPAELDRFLRLGIEPDHAVRHRVAVTSRREPPRPTKDDPEAVFQRYVAIKAGQLGWMHYHVRDSRDASEDGFPDSIIARIPEPGRPKIVYAWQLKAHGKHHTLAQQDWQEALHGATIRADVWHPDELDELMELLR